jgi:hypothetical protein
MACKFCSCTEGALAATWLFAPDPDPAPGGPLFLAIRELVLGLEVPPGNAGFSIFKAPLTTPLTPVLELLLLTIIIVPACAPENPNAAPAYIASSHILSAKLCRGLVHPYEYTQNFSEQHH